MINISQNDNGIKDSNTTQMECLLYIIHVFLQTLVNKHNSDEVVSDQFNELNKT